MRAIVVDPNGSSAAGACPDYSLTCTTRSHVRLLVSLAEAATFVRALRVG